MLDFRMRTFHTLCEVMNYRKTAELLNMTQPGVTQHIQFLEKYYGVKLFEYNGRTLKRTKACEALKKYSDSVQTQERDLRRSLEETDCVLLNVGATKTIGEFVLTEPLNRFLQQENHSLNLVIDNTENLLKMLEAPSLDFAIVEGVFDKTRYFCRLFQKERFVGICSLHHPFAGNCVPLEALFEQSLILREQGSGTRAIFEQAIAQRGFSLACFRRTISAGNFSVIADLVIRQNAITFAYAPVAECRGDLAVFEVEDMKISGEFNFVSCSESVAEEKVALFMGNERMGKK